MVAELAESPPLGPVADLAERLSIRIGAGLNEDAATGGSLFRGNLFAGIPHPAFMRGYYNCMSLETPLP